MPPKSAVQLSRKRASDAAAESKKQRKEDEIAYQQSNEFLTLKLEEEKRKNENLMNQLKEESEKLFASQEQETNMQKRCQELENQVQTEQILKAELQKQLDQLRTRYQQALTDAVNDQKVIIGKEFDEKVEHLQNKLNATILKTPDRGQTLKSYGSLAKKDTKNKRFDRVIDMIREFIGDDFIDQFLHDFIQYISANSKYSFRLSLNECDSFYAVIKWKLSDGFLKDFKSFLKEKLGFDVFSSRHQIVKSKSRFKPEDDYEIDVETSDRNVKSAIVRAKNIGSLLSRRLKTLSEHNNLLFDSSTGEDVVVAFGGDKGGLQTKLVLSIVNVAQPNNPHGLLLLGLYNGSDDYKSLKQKMLSVFQQLNSLEKVIYDENGVQRERNVRKVLIGDCKFISSVFNHAGQASSCPCFRCLASWSTHGARKATLETFRVEEAGELRTLAHYQSQGDPLLLLDPKCAGPPGLHTIVGVTQCYVVNWLIAMAHRHDFNGSLLPIDLKEQRKLLKSLKTEEQYHSEKRDTLEQACRTMQKAYDVISRAVSHVSVRKSSVLPCSSTFCFLSKASKATFASSSSFNCETCKARIHYICGFHFGHDGQPVTDVSFKCIDCSESCQMDLLNRQAVLAMKKTEIEEELRNVIELLDDVLNERESLEGLLTRSEGPMRRRLEAAMRDIGCDSRVWHQDLVGNQARALLRPDNIQKVLSVFPPSQEVQVMAGIMEDLGKIMSSSGNSKKTKEKVDALDFTIKRFLRSLCLLQPDATPTPKLHLMAAHLVEYLRDFGCFGRVTEQGLESLHAIINSLFARFAAVHDVQLQACLIVRHLTMLNVLFDGGSSWLRDD